MEVNTVSSSASTAASSPRPATVDYESFLKLLVAQLKNQDPTDPADGTEFLSQLASFSSVEQGVQMNSKLEALITGSMLGQADSVIGRSVTSADGLVGGAVESVSISGSSLVAHLHNGDSLVLGDGVVISD